MKLFIFRPSAGWHYMGGTVIFAAERFEDIAAMADAEKAKERLFGGSSGAMEFERAEAGALATGSVNYWVLHAEFELKGNVPAGLVLENHNNA